MRYCDCVFTSNYVSPSPPPFSTSTGGYVVGKCSRNEHRVAILAISLLYCLVTQLVGRFGGRALLALASVPSINPSTYLFMTPKEAIGASVRHH